MLLCEKKLFDNLWEAGMSCMILAVSKWGKLATEPMSRNFVVGERSWHKANDSIELSTFPHILLPMQFPLELQLSTDFDTFCRHHDLGNDPDSVLE